MKRQTIAGWAFLLLAIFLVMVALVPVFKGRPLDVTFFALGGFWFIVAVAVAARARKTSGGNADQIK